MVNRFSTQSLELCVVVSVEPEPDPLPVDPLSFSSDSRLSGNGTSSPGVGELLSSELAPSSSSPGVEAGCRESGEECEDVLVRGITGDWGSTLSSSPEDSSS